MKIKVSSGTPEVSIPGLGLVKTNEWVSISKNQEEAFEACHGKPLTKAGFEMKKETKTKEEAS